MLNYDRMLEILYNTYNRSDDGRPRFVDVAQEDHLAYLHLSDWQYVELYYVNSESTRASVRVTAQGYRLLDELEVLIERINLPDEMLALPYRLNYLVPWCKAHRRLEEKWEAEKENGND